MIKSSARLLSRYLPRFDIRMRFLLVALLSLFGFVALTGMAMQFVRQQMIEDRLTKIRHMTEVGRGVIQWQYERFRKGEIDEASARKKALDELRTLRYSNDEYFFVDDFNCISLLLPNFPQWEGRDFSNEVDSNGQYFVRKQRDIALAGGGTVYYTFPKKDDQKSVSKASYILPFTPWQWLIGTGIYLDEVDQEISEILRHLLYGFIAVIACVGILVTLISRSITRPLEQQTRVIERLTRRDYDVSIPGKGRADEIGDIARALEIFKHTGREFEALQLELRNKEAAANLERAAWFEQQRESAVRLEQSSRLITVGELATSLAHELNQPLATITNYCRGCVTLLEEGVTDRDTLLEPMRRASDQANRAAKIIGRIRTYLQRSPMLLDPQNLNEIVVETVELAGPDAQRQGILIDVDIPENLPRIMADRIMIQQLVLNLIRNGIDAIHSVSSGGGQLVVRSRIDGDFVETQVIDCGPGIPEAEREKIFKPFFTTKRDGMGMGLNICRSIIEFHCGRLWVSNNPDGGTIFHFTIPCEETAA